MATSESNTGPSQDQGQKPYSFTTLPGLNTYETPMATMFRNFPGWVGVGAVVFNGEGNALLVQRASEDSSPNKWEIPGGSCEKFDANVLDSTARELYEETHLNNGVITACGTEHRFCRTIREPLPAVKYTFIVKVAELDDIRLNPREHQDFTWASRADVEEALDQHISTSERQIFTSEQQVWEILQAFDVRQRQLRDQAAEALRTGAVTQEDASKSKSST
ncbi:NUDIX hydrolase domain-like protein [Xylariomycetidae sp. FL2044]|nr:NUDIX hydrolase domain-like protein [Xylariomycetidae sp. FL2044]